MMILNAYGIQIKGKPSTWYAEFRRPSIHSAHYVHMPGSVYTKYHFYYIGDNEWKKGQPIAASRLTFSLATKATTEYDANGRQK